MHQQPRRLRSSAVSLGIVGALALSLSGCGTSSASATRRCIDETTLRPTDSAYRVIGDPSCVSSASATSGSFGTTPSHRYYYGGTLSNGYVRGGSFTVPTRSRTTSSSSRHWYNPTSWRSSNTANTSGTSSTSGTTQSGVTTGGLGSSSKTSSGGKSSSSSS